jgi:hypothetical protein
MPSAWDSIRCYSRGHSVRSGFLTSAAKRGASIFKMMVQSRYRSVATLPVTATRPVRQMLLMGGGRALVGSETLRDSWSARRAHNSKSRRRAPLIDVIGRQLQRGCALGKLIDAKMARTFLKIADSVDRITMSNDSAQGRAVGAHPQDGRLQLPAKNNLTLRFWEHPINNGETTVKRTTSG